MRVLQLNKQTFSCITKCRQLATALTQDEYTPTPHYPPILDVAPDKIRERQKEQEYEEIKAVKTVEEKQIKLNMPKFYGFKCYILKESYIPYNNLQLIEHVTRTHLMQNQVLPDFYNTIDVTEAAKAVKCDVEEALLFELEGYQRINDLKTNEVDKAEAENTVSSVLTWQINRIILKNLARKYPHLSNAQVDIDSRIESFWFAGGMNPPENIRRYRRGTEWQKHKEDEPTNRVMNYIGGANVALRSDQLLAPILAYHEAENPEFTVPFYNLDPRTVGTETTHKHIANIPGFWPGDANEFGLLSYHGRGHMLTRQYGDPEDDIAALHRQGILSSFGWLNAQANFLGFNTFNDITYPLVTQTIITNGKIWSFYIYQLNTLVNHSKYVYENPKRNLCWATPELKLFENVENGALIGFNDEVLNMLVKLYVNTPEPRLGINLKPYLSQEEKVSADYADDDKREWLENEYKYLVANRPRHKIPYEIYAWEKIYKIDHNTRFMDKRRRPFELNIKPFNRRLDDRKPRYIPRALRPDLPRHKGRNAKEYFP